MTQKIKLKENLEILLHIKGEKNQTKTSQGNVIIQGNSNDILNALMSFYDYQPELYSLIKVSVNLQEKHKKINQDFYKNLNK